MMRMDELRKGVRRWILDISNWKPSQHNFSTTLSVLPCHLHSSVTRFIQIEDQKRALISRLLQYALLHQVLGIPFQQITINPTLQGKPYLERYENINFPNFNFNVMQNETVPLFLHQFSSYFATSEWGKINAAANHSEMLDEFYRYWCVKESFVKAVGSGVGYRLDFVEVDHDKWTNISVKIDGQELNHWKFDLFELGRAHSVCIAKGHPSIATEDCKKRLNQTDFEEEDYLMYSSSSLSSSEMHIGFLTKSNTNT